MTAEQKQKVRQLLESALEIEESGRIAHIERLCEDDPSLRDLVQTLLDGRGPAQGFLGDDTSPRGLAPVFRADELIAGRFRIVRFHGRGGMGEVYEAYDERLRIRLGLKTLRADLQPGLDGIERFQREILIAREVSHPNLCRVYDLIEHNSGATTLVCLTMEWIEGETLQSLLLRERPMAPPDALPIIEQIAAALDALHMAGIVHRDLKPGNIMLTRQADGRPRAVVMDFGLAKPAARDEAWFESSVDAGAGAPYFMATEQMRGDRPTPASDIFSFGLVIDEMVTTTRAYNAGSLGGVIYQRLSEPPLPPSSRSSNLPSHWESVILRCLALDPAARYARATDAASALALDLPAIPVRPLPRRAEWQRGFWLLAAAVLVLLIAASFGARAPRLDTTLVVFPIADLAGDPVYRHLPTGVTAALVTQLAHIDGLSVKRYYQPRDQAPLQVIRGRYHLDGDFQKYKDQGRLTLRLTDSDQDGSIVWTNSIDGSLNDPLDLQKKVAAAVIKGLESRVLAASGRIDQARYAGFRTLKSMQEIFGFLNGPQVPATDPEAYRDYLRARQLLDDRTPSTVRSAVEVLERAIAKDPRFALAHATLSDAYRAVIDGRQGPQDLIYKSREHALRAISLAPDSPEAHIALAGVQQMEWDWKGSEASYRRAIEADPKFPTSYRRFGGLLVQFGRFDEAFALVRKGIEMDPYDYPSQAAYGMYLSMARRFGEARQQLEWVISQRDFISAHNNLGTVYAVLATQAKTDERTRLFELALGEAAAVRRHELQGRSAGSTPVSDYMFALIHAMRGDLTSSHQVLERLQASAGIDRVAPASLALIYSALNEKDAAVQYLRQAARIKDRGLLYLKVLALWDPIRDTEGYREVVAHMNL